MQPSATNSAPTVLVELVCDREYKDDCRANTGIVWRGQGDRQRFPAALWPKLAAHPDVWRLVPEEGGPVVSDESPSDQRRRESAQEAERVRAAAENAAAKQDPAITPDLQKATAEAKEKALGDGIDLQTVITDQEVDELATYSALTEDVQAAMSVDAMRELAVKLDYGLHPRLNEANLRHHFAEVTAKRLEQATEQSDTSGVDDTTGPT